MNSLNIDLNKKLKKDVKKHSINSHLNLNSWKWVVAILDQLVFQLSIFIILGKSSSEILITSGILLTIFFYIFLKYDSGFLSFNKNISSTLISALLTVFLGVIPWVYKDISVTELYALVLIPALFLTMWRLVQVFTMNKARFLENRCLYITDSEAFDESIQKIEKIEPLVTIKNSLYLETSFPFQLERILNLIEKKSYHSIIIALKHYDQHKDKVKTIFTKSLYGKSDIYPLNLFIEQKLEYIPLEHYNYTSTFKFSRKNPILDSFQRCNDVFFSGFILFFFIFTLPLIIVLNFFFNKGPLFFRQKRVGINGNEFVIYKLRSMIVDAEKNGAKMATKNDSRVTKFGKILRKTRLDELPQLWNVLNGDMSLIGPRPERKIFVDELVKIEPMYEIRHKTKPGLSGWAQVKYKYGENLDDSLRKLEYDLFYIKNRSFSLYFRIFLKTISTVIFSKGQ